MCILPYANVQNMQIPIYRCQHVLLYSSICFWVPCSLLCFHNFLYQSPFSGFPFVRCTFSFLTNVRTPFSDVSFQSIYFHIVLSSDLPLQRAIVQLLLWDDAFSTGRPECKIPTTILNRVLSMVAFPRLFFCIVCRNCHCIRCLHHHVSFWGCPFRRFLFRLFLSSCFLSWIPFSIFLFLYVHFHICLSPNPTLP